MKSSVYSVGKRVGILCMVYLLLVSGRTWAEEPGLALPASDQLVLVAANYDFIHVSHGLARRYIEMEQPDKAVLLYRTPLELEHFSSGDDAIAAMAVEIFDAFANPASSRTPLTATPRHTH